MRHPQVVVFESDGRLAGQLAPLAAERKWALRESRQAGACMRLLAEGGPIVLVIRITEPVQPPLEMLVSVAQRIPGIRCVAVGGSEPSVVVEGLAWDLGADYVLFPPTSSEILPEVVAGLMEVAELPS